MIKGRKIFDLTGKTAIVTGGGTGLGRAMALYLAEFGADVAIPDLQLDRAREVSQEIESLGRKALALKTDISQLDQIDTMVKEVLDWSGHIDILVNNAGINIRELALEVTEEHWDKVFDVNIKGLFFCAQAVGKVMIQQKRGKIINIASIMGAIAYPLRAAYCSSKGGVIQLTKLLAVEWAPYNIHVNAIAPAFFVTPMNAPLLSEEKTKASLLANTPLGRLGEPEDLGGAVVFLASEASDYVTGITLFVDGGWTAR